MSEYPDFQKKFVQDGIKCYKTGHCTLGFKKYSQLSKLHDQFIHKVHSGEYFLKNVPIKVYSWSNLQFDGTVIENRQDGYALVKLQDGREGLVECKRISQK